jgi:hypothetical protein
MFWSSTILRELVLSLAKFILKHSVKLCPYRLCDSVAACLGVECVLCVVQNEIESGGVFFVARPSTSPLMMVEGRNM